MAQENLPAPDDELVEAEDITFDEVMAELAKHVSYRPQEGHFSREDLEKEFGMTENEARKQIDRWKKAGIIEFAGKYSRWFYYRYVG